MPTRLHRLADTVDGLRQTSSRKAKSELLAALFTELDGDEVEPAIGFLLARPRQGAIGVGWATVAKLDPASADVSAPADDDTPPPTVGGLDEVAARITITTGTGSEAARADILNRFLAGCDEAEVDFVRRILSGDNRQGALQGVITDAVAKASGTKIAVMRRGVMLQGDLGLAATVAMTEGPEAVAAIDLTVGRPIQPMLASTAPDVATAIETISADGEPASVEWKLDGARIQVHIDHDRPERPVGIYTRNLNDVTGRLTQVVDLALALPCRSAVLDGEVLGFFDESAPQAFQDTMSAFGTRTIGAGEDQEPQAAPAAAGLRPYFFDLMYLDGRSLIDEPLSGRLDALAALVGDAAIPRVMTVDADEGQHHLDEALAQGHEGVMVKASTGGYEAGRRGKSWFKVKPVHTIDLVVLGAEWGHGRRQGWLSNLHLGARDPDTDEFVMVGKTFKGLTDELLAWQTEAFQAIKSRDAGHTVYVRPEIVVEIALDGAQSSTRYPGGVALRFARVKGYRADKKPAEADTLDAVRALLPGNR